MRFQSRKKLKGPIIEPVAANDNVPMLSSDPYDQSGKNRDDNGEKWAFSSVCVNIVMLVLEEVGRGFANWHFSKVEGSNYAIFRLDG